jgi:transposase InsO family protein
VKNNSYIYGTQTKTKTNPAVTEISQGSEFYTLLKEYPEITKPAGIDRKVKHNTVHYIITKDEPPKTCKVRPLNPKNHAEVKKQYEALLASGTVKRSKSNWSAGLVVVQKPDGKLRLCADFKPLNAITLPDRYPVRFLTDFQHLLPGCTTFSTLDLVAAFHQIPVFKDHIHKTAVITPFGLFDYHFMPFGLRNAAQTCQRFIDEVLEGLPFAFPYVDDILIASKSKSEHKIHLRLVFERLKKFGVVINTKKCVLAQPEVDFLGFRVTSMGIAPKRDNVKAILEYPKPKILGELRRYLGMLNFYHKFLPKAASLQAPLNALIAGPKRSKRTPLQWSDEAQLAFENCKQALADCVQLAHPMADARLALVCDASDFAMGASLNQWSQGAWQPLAFFSKKFTPTQMKYSAYDRELLAIYSAIKYFRHNVETRTFTVFTDHKPLISMFKKNLDNCTPRQYHHIDFISQFTEDIQHIAGHLNVVADAFSRVEIDAIASPLASHDFLDYAELSKAQQADNELKDLRAKGTALILENVPVPETDLTIVCDTSSGKVRPYLPVAFRKIVHQKLHSLSHLGIKATCRLLHERFVWPKMKKDITIWTRACHACQISKITRHVKTPLGNFETPSSRFINIHIDIVGPLPESHSYRYLLTIIDRFSRWMEAIPLQDITADSVCRAMYREWICRFGVPHRCTSDQGRQFMSDLFRKFSNLFGIKLYRTTAYHPQCNGMIERVHRTLKSALKAHNNPSWFETLPTVLLGLRVHCKEDIKSSPAELVYGEPLRVPGEFFTPSQNTITDADLLKNLRQTFANLRPSPVSRHANPDSFVFRELDSTPCVYERDDTVRGPLQRPYTGPYPVLTRTDKTFTILKNNKQVVVSKDRLKPAFTLTNPSPPSVPDIINPTNIRISATHPLNANVPQDTHGRAAARTTDVNTPAEQLPATTRSGRVVRPPQAYSP